MKRRNTMRTKNWTITEAPIDDDNMFKTSVAPQEHTLPFRLLDDDGVVYFLGYMRPTQSEALFRPLDIVGDSYGCTSIEIMENGKWEVV
jgi:hypothetical protein